MINDFKFQIAPQFLATISAIVLLVLFSSACAQKKKPQPEVGPPEATQSTIALPVRVKKVQSEGCRDCHSSETDVAAEVFSSIFDTPEIHHPIGVRYPDAAVVPNWAKPSGQDKEIAFFDRNENGKPDSDEILLFGAAGDATVECASCHVQHGSPSNTPKDPVKFYLRFENRGSALCTTCHQY